MLCLGVVYKVTFLIILRPRVGSTNHVELWFPLSPTNHVSSLPPFSGLGVL